MCARDQNAIYVLRGRGFQSRRGRWLCRIRPIDEFMNKDTKTCPVAAALTDADRASLLWDKQGSKRRSNPAGSTGRNRRSRSAATLHSPPGSPMEKPPSPAPSASPSTSVQPPRPRLGRRPASADLLDLTAIHLGPWAKLITSQGRSGPLVLSASGQTQSGEARRTPRSSPVSTTSGTVEVDDGEGLERPRMEND